jgi:tRNA1Val (adenine37-N6)-methyltransferase
MTARVVRIDPELGALTDDLLTPDVRVFQRARGHRFSSDDVATAYVAHRACPSAHNVLDLGSGLGSVLLILAWKMREAVFSAVEAQAPSYALLARNVARSGFGDRIWTRHADFRAVADELDARGPFDLVTGTPPYFAPDACVAAIDAQREFARVEHRGGVEAYVDAGARALAPGGVLVICGEARSAERVERVAPKHGVILVEAVEVVPKEGKTALFSVWVLRRSTANSATPIRRTMTLRTSRGDTTLDADALRTFSGFPSRESRGPRGHL